MLPLCGRFLCGEALTEADVRLFPTMFRLDAVYHLRFKLNRAFLHEGYPAAQRWLQEVRSLPPLLNSCCKSQP